MVQPQTLPLLKAAAAVLTISIILNEQLHHSVEAWIPRGGGNSLANINGQPNRIPSSSNLFMKKRDRKQKKKRGDFKIAEAKDVDGIGQLAADHYFSYDSSSGLVARLSMYGIDSFTQQQEPFLEKPERVKIEAEDWSQLAEGPCLGDCCGDDCDEQCEIPEDYKRFADKDIKVDVMAFLGIKRAEPLRVQRDWD